MPNHEIIILDTETTGVLEEDRIIQLSYIVTRSEEHTSELQSHLNLVCRLLLEKKKKYYKNTLLCGIMN